MGSLNNKIQELETQNRALASMLVHQLRGEAPNTPTDLENVVSKQSPSEEEKQKDNKDTSANASSPAPLMQASLNIKHYNSFNSEVLEESPSSENCDNKVVSNIDKRLSADTANILGKRYS